MRKIDIDIQELSNKYKSGLSASSLARHYDVSVWSVITRLRKSGIQIRQNQNEIFLNLTSDDSEKFREIVDGLLLGDGSIDLHKSFLRLEQCENRYCWIEQVSDALFRLGCDHKILPIPCRTRYIEGRKIVSKPANLLYTRSYSEIKPQQARWYPGGKKHVPTDIILSPTVVAHWFSGDGSCNDQGSLWFYTNGFAPDETQFLSDQLNKQLNICSSLDKTLRNDQFKIRVSKKESVKRLRDTILPHIPECIMYKLRFTR